MIDDPPPEERGERTVFNEKPIAEGLAMGSAPLGSENGGALAERAQNAVLTQLFLPEFNEKARTGGWCGPQQFPARKRGERNRKQCAGGRTD